jgi:glycosyltransferase involved in cell wall biosynthesis
MIADEDTLIKFNLAYKKTFKSNFVTGAYKAACDIVSTRNYKNIVENYSISNSIFISKLFNKIYNKDIEVVYPSLPILKSNNSESKKLKQILTISRFSKNKNVHSLLNIFDDINKNLPGFKFIIAGFVEDESYYDLISKSCKSKSYQIELKPNQTSQEIELLYNQSEYYINPKEYEHFGIAVLESMYFNCIPLVHKSGGSIELVPFPQLHFHEQNEIVQLISHIENNVTRKADLKNGLKSNLEKFSVEHFDRQLIGHLNSYFDMKK